MKTTRHIQWLIFIGAFVVLTWFAFQWNFEEGKPVRRGVFYSDRSIYYVYLPATFIYGWDARNFPSGMDTNYRGFILDTVNGKVKAKMTCGVALLWLPFFTITHFVATVFDLQPDGFSEIYQYAALLPPVIFLLLGLFFLRKFLRYYFPEEIVLITLLLLVAGTSLIYYSLAEGLMSHVHSFFLFSVWLFLLKRWIDGGMHSFRLFLLISLAGSLIILVRPVNIIILGSLFFLDVRNLNDLRERMKGLLRPRQILAGGLIAFLVFLPQLIYWRYLSGSFLHYSYGGEGFSHWREPAIAEVLFSPLNGLITYSPLVAFILAGAIWMLIRRQANAWLILLVFAAVAYTSGAWHMWYFGGGFGSRPFTEYLALFSPGLAFLLVKVRDVKYRVLNILILIILLLTVWYNLRLAVYNPWNTAGARAWDDFLKRIEQAGILTIRQKSYTTTQDFENVNFDPALHLNEFQNHSLYWSAYTDPRRDEYLLYKLPVKGILDEKVRKITVGLWTRPLYGPFRAWLQVEVMDGKETVWIKETLQIGGDPMESNDWKEKTMDIRLTRWMNAPDYTVVVKLLNPDRRTFYLDDISIGFHAGN